MTDLSADESVLFHVLPAGEFQLGVMTLNMPARLNALTHAMLLLLQRQLDAWKNNPRIAAVVLQGAGAKAFCAGGDLRELVQGLEAGAGTDSRAFFKHEYALDLSLHRFPKPLVAIGHGITMGGGMGLFQGASHRVISDDSVLAMPEITIGLFPDVGAAWFLQRTPGRIGLFAGLTGFRFDAADAVLCGLADYRLQPEHLPGLAEQIAGLALRGDPAADKDSISRMLRGRHTASGRSGLLDRLEAVNAAMDARNPLALRDGLLGLAAQDPWFKPCVDRMQAGSPTSFAVTVEQFHRARHYSLRQVLEQDLMTALRCCDHADFREGVRALLIDKDMRPAWSPASLEAVAPAQVAGFFEMA